VTLENLLKGAPSPERFLVPRHARLAMTLIRQALSKERTAIIFLSRPLSHLCKIRVIIELERKTLSSSRESQVPPPPSWLSLLFSHLLRENTHEIPGFPTTVEDQAEDSPILL
jgi:hypothetical protein